MSLGFSKMHGLGNDFVVIDGVRQRIALDEAQRRLIADRHRGVGCDQILLLEPSDDDRHDFIYRIFNADGGEVGQCGNGARCVSRFAYDKGLTTKTGLRLKTRNGSLRTELLADGSVRVDMGIPDFRPQALPFNAALAEPSRGEPLADYRLSAANETLAFAIASMGNPHAVILVADVDQAAVARQGAELGAHPAFPEGVNVGFMAIVSPTQIKLRVFERGSGETLACGSGACAAVATGRRHGLLDANVAVDLRGGRLLIEWPGEGQALWMSGPATQVFDGKMAL